MVGLLFVVLFALRLLNPRRIKPSAKGDKPAASKQAPQIAPEPMLACAHCKTLVPKSEAVFADGRAYCSHEHAQQGQD
jgi:uncharacterized protein